MTRVEVGIVAFIALALWAFWRVSPSQLQPATQADIQRLQGQINELKTRR